MRSAAGGTYEQGTMTIVFWLVAQLPLRALHAIGGFLGMIMMRRPSRYTNRLRENYRKAFPQATEADFIEAGRSAGRMALELPFFWMRRDPLAGLPDPFEGLWPTMHRLHAQGKGLILMSPHLGCFEATPAACIRHYPATVLYKPPHNPKFRAWLEKVRTRPALTMAPAEPRGVRMLVKALRRGEMIGILPDQTPPGGEGVWAPYFGRPAYTMTLLHGLQRHSGAPILLLGMERLPQGKGYRGLMHEIPTPLPADPVEASTLLNKAMEDMIALAPNQYLWGYNRYKHPQGA